MDFGVLFLNFIGAKENVFIAKTPELLAKPNFVAITTGSRIGPRASPSRSSLARVFQSFSEAMSMEKRYFTSDFRIRS